MCRSASGRRRSWPTVARSGSPTSSDGTVSQIDVAQAPRRGNDRAGHRHRRARRRGRFGMDRRQPGAAGPCAWMPTSGRWRIRCHFPRGRRRLDFTATRRRARLPLGAEHAARRGVQARHREQARERARRRRQRAGRDRGGRGCRLGRRQHRQHRPPDRARRRRRGDEHDPARQRARTDRGRRGRDLGREQPRRHGVPDRSRHARGRSPDPGRPAPVRHRGRRRRGVGGEQPLGDRVAHRSAHEPRRRRRSVSEGRPSRSRSPAAACGSASRRPRRARRRSVAGRWLRVLLDQYPDIARSRGLGDTPAACMRRARGS